MNKGYYILLLSVVILNALPVVAQFAPQAGVAGSTAIGKNDNKFVGWANGCSLRRGFMHIEDKSLGMASTGDHTMATGKADNYVVSLGDSGVATLTFESPVYNGAGADFAIFENGFSNPTNPEEAFLELAFVEVSSDGNVFVRFPASSLTPPPQIPVAGVYMDARKLNNLAGKYVSGYGTPFDLDELVGSAGLDVNNITHIRLVDVVGALGSAGTSDKDGNRINDPYPTPLPGSGFDLDAVGVLYMKGKFPANIAETGKPAISIYPNPVADKLVVNTSEDLSVSITDVSGKVLYTNDIKDRTEISFSDLSAGVYYISCVGTNGHKWVEKIIKL